MAYSFLRHEEVRPKQQQLGLISVDFTISRHVQMPYLTFASPHWVYHVIHKREFLRRCQEVDSIVDCLYFIDPQEIVIVSVTIQVKRELRVKCI